MRASREKSSLDLHVTLDGRRDVARQLYRQIRDAVLDGRVRAGEHLPSSRELARRLQIARGTVVVVYERLRAEGFIESRIGAGTFAGDAARPRSTGRVADSPLRPRALWEEIGETPDMSAVRVAYDFRPGVPDAARFPFAPWRARVARQFGRRAVGTGAHIGAAGHPGLRTAIARHIGVSRGVRAGPDDVFVTNGSQQAIDLIARVLLAPGDVVAVEDPGYPLPRRAFQAHGCRVVGVPVDAEGIVVDAIPADARLVYVTPSHQYPLGMVMSMARRRALLDWAQHADAAIIEDDYDSEFRFDGRPLEALHSLDNSGRVLYVGSLSKVMLPTLRLGFAVVPEPLHAALRRAKAAADWHTTVPLQAAAADFIDDGLLAQHIRRMRRVYAERHALITRLLARVSTDICVLPARGGLHLSALLPGHEPPADHAIAAAARARDVAVLPLSYHYVDAPPRAGLLIGFGAIPVTRIEEGLDLLRASL